jgi:hypothetical protein
MPWPSGRIGLISPGAKAPGRGAAGFGPPAFELGVGVGAGVGGEVGEELVDAEAVGHGAVGGDPADPSGGVAGAGWGLIAGGGDEFGSGVAEDVVPGVGAAAGP